MNPGLEHTRVFCCMAQNENINNWKNKPEEKFIGIRTTGFMLTEMRIYC